MNIEVELPDLGNFAGDHATVVEWHFEEGESVEQGEILMEVACEAGVIEVPAPRAGVLIERVVEEDEIVRVGEPVALMECSDEDEAVEEDEEEE
ncbi:MAG: lipoyl domain-containing protein [Candidatus Brocadiia bacterium]|jgi:2-oxoglutarate dehydrogenase E2 component (dihydrolipoamide succinyltransferase)